MGSKQTHTPYGFSKMHDFAEKTRLVESSTGTFLWCPLFDGVPLDNGITVFVCFFPGTCNSPSISQPLIYYVLQRFAFLKPGILLKKETHRLILPVGCVVRAVR